MASGSPRSSRRSIAMCFGLRICLFALAFIVQRARCVFSSDTNEEDAKPCHALSTFSGMRVDLNADAGAMLRAEKQATRMWTKEAEISFDGEADTTSSTQHNETMTMISALTPEVRSFYPQAEEILERLSQIYDGHATDAFYLDSNDKGREEAANVTHDKDAHVYGELLPQSVLQLFANLSIKTGSKFYDLGSGTGKIVILAGLCGLKATGIELIEGRYQESCSRLKRQREGEQTDGHAKFLWASFLEQDFSDADILFTDSVLFNNQTLNGVSEIAKFMKPGSYIVTAFGLPQPCKDWFEDVKTVDLGVTWTATYTYTIQRVKKNDFNKGGSRPSVSESKKEVCDIKATRQSGAQLPGPLLTGGFKETLVYRVEATLVTQQFVSKDLA